MFSQVPFKAWKITRVIYLDGRAFSFVDNDFFQESGVVVNIDLPKGLRK